MKLVLVSKFNSYNWKDIYDIVFLQLEKLIDLKNIKNKKILLKPNLLAAHSPAKAVTTHPEFLRAIIKIFKENNTIIVADSLSML